MKTDKCYFKNFYESFLGMLCSLIFMGCCATVEAQTDYGLLQNWAAHPWKSDPSDSVPLPLQENYFNDSTVDVFFVYPTSYTQTKFTHWNASIEDSALNAKTDANAILYQASVFNASCRVFAPRYRQAHLQSFFIEKDTAQTYFDTAYADVKSSFEYYLKHFNGGRPIIIAAHSQGTLHAARLLKDFFEGSLLKNRLVCAYLIGLPVPENYFTELPVCDNEFRTGCFVSWRTFKSGFVPEEVKSESFKAIVVNPLTWSQSDTLAAPALNKGSVLKNFNKLVPHTVSAQIHGNILWTSKPDIPGKIFLTQKNYHVGDINLFYMNIRENVATRIRLFWK